MFHLLLHELKAFYLFFFQVILIATLAQFKPLKLGTYTFPVWSSVLGWLIVLSCIGFVPVVAVYEIFYQKRGTLAEVS